MEGQDFRADISLWLAGVGSMSRVPLETLESLEILDEVVQKGANATGDDWDEVARRAHVIANGLTTGASASPFGSSRRGRWTAQGTRQDLTSPL